MAVVNEYDLVPQSWLEVGCNASKAVARLSVFRYDHGSSTEPSQLYYGTGWLIGRQHIITNHHVINARKKMNQTPQPKTWNCRRKIPLSNLTTILQ